MNEPLVSIIIPTFKRNKLLDKTINSVINQNYKNYEIIVVDDNDEETEYRKETENLMKKYINNPKIRYIKHPKNLNGCAARNTGMEYSKGKYICFLDDDDIIYKEKLKEQVAFLEKNKNYNAVCCNRKVGQYIHTPKIKDDLSFYLLSGEHIVVTIMLMFRSSSIKKIKWNTKLKRNQEAAFLLEFFAEGNKLGKVEKVLCETNLEDRKNSLCARKNEYEILKYLKEYKYIIDKLIINDKLVKKKIYCHRYLGIILCYLKERKIISALRVCRKAINESPKIFCSYLINYIYNRYNKSKKDYIMEKKC